MSMSSLEWFRGPGAEPASENDLYRALATACYVVHPAIRHDSQARWVMDLGWYKRIRATMPAQPDGEEDPEKWKPDPEDRMMGIRIEVTKDGGAPHIENRRYPARWSDLSP